MGHLGASWSRLGKSRGVLEASWERLGVSWGRLGASWEHLGSPNLPRYDFYVNFPWILAPISTLGTTKIIDFSLFFQCFLGFRGF